MTYPDPHSDLSYLTRQSKAEDEFERAVDAKLWEVKMRLSTKEGAEEFILDYEPDLAEMLSCLARSDTLAASVAFGELLLKQAEYEAEKEILS